MRLIGVKGGWVAEDHVVRVTRVGGDEYALEGRDGQIIGRTRPGWHPVGEPVTILPAAPGAAAWVIAIDDDHRPTINDVYRTLVPIIGWRVFSESLGVEPILVQQPASREWVLIPLPDGSVIEINMEQRVSLDAAAAAYLRREQDEWDRVHKTGGAP